jgi:beta-glucosidase
MRRLLPTRTARRSCTQHLVILALATAVSACSSQPVAPDGPPADTAGDAPADQPQGDGGPGADADAVQPPDDLGYFPPGFLWGTASAAFQSEGGNENSDWTQWAATPGKIKNGDKPDDGPDYFTHFDEDHDRAMTARHNAIRVGIEWSRIYPTADSFDNDTPDPAALDFYDRLLASIRTRAMKPMITLQHLTLPDWLLDLNDLQNKKGWLDPAIIPRFTEFARRMAARFGDRVDLWLTINEPQTVVLAGYLVGYFPPGEIANFDDSMQVYANMIRAHAAAYDAIKAADTVDADGDGKPALVSFATHNRVFQAAEASNPDDVRAADRLRDFTNHFFLRAVTKGDMDFNYDGKFDGPNEVQDDPTLKNRLDYIGLNYYGLSVVTYLGDNIPILGLPALVDLRTPNPKTDVGWDIYPQGFGTVLDELVQYNLPIHITENGVADQGDTQKARFVAEHLLEALKAIGRGVDVRGYFYWALTDNFEWAEGYCPRFGLWRVDYTSTQRTRTATAAVATLQSIIEANTIPAGLLDSLPPYGRAVRCDP